MGHAGAERHNETTPLLGDISEVNNAASATLQTHVSSKDKKAKLSLLVLLAVLLVIFDFGGYLGTAPQIEIFEQIACEHFYHDKDVEVPFQNGTTPSGPMAPGVQHPLNVQASASNSLRDCTIDPIQNEVALVTQLLNTFDQVPSILLAVPFGILADRLGRRPILLVSIGGLVLEDIFTKVVCWFPTILPLRLVWLTPIFRILGGGDGVASSLLLTMVADTFPEDERSNAYSVLAAAVLISDITASPLSAVMMQKSPWLPWIITTGMFVVGMIVTAFFLPETLPSRKGELHGERPALSDSKNTTKARLGSLVRTIPELTAFIFQKSSVVLLLLSFFVASLARQSTAFQLQYVHKRFGWSYARASFLIAVRGSVNLILILALLPAIAKVLQHRFSYIAASKDLLITRWSASISTIGCLLIAIASKPPLMISGVILLALGNGFGIHGRSLITTYVEPEQVGTLFTAIGTLTAAGALVAGPLLAGGFRWGLSLGGGWVGLPFLAVTALFAFAAAAVGAVRIPCVCDRGQTGQREERDV